MSIVDRSIARRLSVVSLTMSVVLWVSISFGHADSSMTKTFSLLSSAFTQGKLMPRRYTCEGQNISPPLSWSGVPAGTKSLALIVDDPDAPDPAHPKTTWVHWVVYNIPAHVSELTEGSADLPESTREGVNDWKRQGYGGPCPPVGLHRYVHTLYALDTELADLGPVTKAQLKQAMKGHVMGQAELIGLYEKDHLSNLK